MKIDFQVRGAAEIERVLKELGPTPARRVAGAALRAGAKPIEKRAKELVLVRTGELKKAITIRLARQGQNKDLRVAFIGIRKPTSRRAHFVEFGTINMAAKPFMRPSLDEKTPEAIDIIGRKLGDGIEREAQKLASKYATKRSKG